MENIERTQFVVLTGHLDEQPLPELIRRLRVQRKSGRLQIEYPEGPGSFFFEEGQMVDARLGNLRGVEALHAALALDGASFNFNPLVRPPERSIDRQEQQFIRDLVETPRREGLAEIRVAGGGREQRPAVPAPLPQGAPLQLGPAAAELVAPLEERLSAVEGAIVASSRRFSRERLVYAVIIGFLVGLSLITSLNILYGPFNRGRSTPAAKAAPDAQAPQAAGRQQAATRTAPQASGGAERQGAAPTASAAAAQTPNTNERERAEAAGAAPPPVPAAAAVIGTRRAENVAGARREYVVEVLVEVKAGRVTDARVWNPRPGAGAYEAIALSMARERRYPEGFTGGERLKIRVRP